MYQKKKNESRKKMKSEDEKRFPKISISWYKPTYGKLPMKSYK